MERGRFPWRPPHQPGFSSWEVTAVYERLYVDIHTRAAHYLQLGEPTLQKITQRFKKIPENIKFAKSQNTQNNHIKISWTLQLFKFSSATTPNI